MRCWCWCACRARCRCARPTCTTAHRGRHSLRRPWRRSRPRARASSDQAAWPGPDDGNSRPCAQTHDATLDHPLRRVCFVGEDFLGLPLRKPGHVCGGSSHDEALVQQRVFSGVVEERLEGRVLRRWQQPCGVAGSRCRDEPVRLWADRLALASERDEAELFGRSGVEDNGRHRVPRMITEAMGAVASRRTSLHACPRCAATILEIVSPSGASGSALLRMRVPGFVAHSSTSAARLTAAVGWLMPRPSLASNRCRRFRARA